MLSKRPKLKFIPLIIALGLQGFLLVNPAWPDNQPSQEKFTFTILHTNDLHSHEDSFEDHGKSVGGMARIAHLIKTTKKNNPKAIAVDAGDLFQGTGYFEHYKGQSDIECLNKSNYDLITLGNHDLDEGPANLGKQLKLAKFDVISCNLDVSSEPSLKELVKPSLVKEIGGEKVAFVGVMTPALKEIQPKMEGLKIISEGPRWLDPVRLEVEKLKKQGINKIILVSHVGVDLERLLAEIPDVDVVVGGHSHTRLDKPIIINHPDGTKAIVVQTGCYGRALGRLDLVFDKDGKLVVPDTKYHLINITDKIFDDPEVKAYVTEMGKPFEAVTKTVVAMAEANFESRFKSLPWDSSIGDLICDALLDAAIDHGATIAIQNRGGIRSGIDQGQITLEKVHQVLPFQNKLVVATVSGATLLQVLENSVSAGGTGGRFLDVHGLKFGWDPTLELGHRIVYAYAQNKEGIYEAISADDLYRIAVNDFTFNGGEGYDFKDAKDVNQLGMRLSAVFENYLKKKKLVSPSVPNRFLRVSSNIAKKNEKGDLINIDYPVPEAEISIIGGTARGVSFLPKMGVVPLLDPSIIRNTKTDDAGRLEVKVGDLASRGGKARKSTNDEFWVAVVLKARDNDGNTTRIVSVPIQIR